MTALRRALDTGDFDFFPTFEALAEARGRLFAAVLAAPGLGGNLAVAGLVLRAGVAADLADLAAGLGTVFATGLGAAFDGNRAGAGPAKAASSACSMARATCSIGAMPSIERRIPWSR